VIFIGRPTYGSFTAQTEDCLVPAIAELGNRGLMDRFPYTEGGPYIDKNRNAIVEEARKSGASHLFFLDSDMVFPPDAIPRLIERKKPVIGGAYRSGLGRFVTIKVRDEVGELHDLEDPLATEPFRAAIVATGFMLIEMSVFEKIEPPWFDAHYSKYPYFVGEDADFCAKCERVGIEVWVDPTIPLGHAKTTIVWNGEITPRQ
jgi:GT2 family glycosyltransferase